MPTNPDLIWLQVIRTYSRITIFAQQEYFSLGNPDFEYRYTYIFIFKQLYYYTVHCDSPSGPGNIFGPALSATGILPTAHPANDL
jgi:hypothetical protein